MTFGSSRLISLAIWTGKTQHERNRISSVGRLDPSYTGGIMNNIYQLSEEIQRVSDLFDQEASANEGEVSDELANALDQLTAELDDNAPGLGNLYRKLRNEGEQYKSQAKRFADVGKMKSDQSDRLKACVLQAMQAAGKKKLADFSVCKNGGLVPVEFHSHIAVSEEFIHRVPEVDQGKVRQALNEGRNLAFASFGVRGSHVRIKA